MVCVIKHGSLLSLSAILAVCSLGLGACGAPEDSGGGASHTSGPSVASSDHSSSREPGYAGPALPPTAQAEARPNTEAPAQTLPSPDQPSEPVDCSEVKCVALTFDDGPGPYTQQVLDALNKHGAKATFFVIGTQVERYPSLVQAAAKDGMELGNHTWDHADLSRLSSAQRQIEIGKVDAELSSLVGMAPRFMRPPGGALSHSQKVSLEKPIADWSVDTEDWRTRNTASTIAAASAAKPGEIVLMHDIHPSTANGVEQIVENLQAKGYQLVTLTELIGKHPKLGVAYGWGKHPSSK